MRRFDSAKETETPAENYPWGESLAEPENRIRIQQISRPAEVHPQDEPLALVEQFSELTRREKPEPLRLPTEGKCQGSKRSKHWLVEPQRHHTGRKGSDTMQLTVDAIGGPRHRKKFMDPVCILQRK